MERVVESVFAAPLGTIFVLAGLVFLFVAVVGNISGKIEPGPKARVLSGTLGAIFVALGTSIQWSSLPKPEPASPPLAAQSDKSTQGDQPATAKASNRPQIKTSDAQSVAVSASPNDQIPEWVSIYPGAKVENLFTKKGKEQDQYGTFFFLTSDDTLSVDNFYEAVLKSADWDVKNDYGEVIGKSKSGMRTVTISTWHQADKTKAIVSFTEANKQ